MLSSPIILYDYPQVAPESPGNFFDGGEIDEILTLRILTMTDEEKKDMSAVDVRARELLARTESLGGEEMSRLHGAMRPSRPPVEMRGMEGWDPEADRRKAGMRSRRPLPRCGRATAFGCVRAAAPTSWIWRWRG